MSRLLIRLEGGLVRLEEMAIFAVLMGLVANLFLQVLFRFVVKLPLDFTEEVSRVLLIWLVFLGAARGVYVGQHFLVSLAFDALPGTARWVVGVLVDLTTVGFLGLLMWFSWQSSQAGAIQVLPVLGTSVMVQTLAMPVGTSLMALHALMLPMRRWSGGDALAGATSNEEVVS